MTDQEWERCQPRLLLKALLARGPHAVSKELIVEDLWPDAAPKTGENNLRVNLHRLRKTLEPSLDKDAGSAYLHFQGNLLTLDQDLCQIDAYDSPPCAGGPRPQKRRGTPGPPWPCTRKPSSFTAAISWPMSPTPPGRRTGGRSCAAPTWTPCCAWPSFSRSGAL